MDGWRGQREKWKEGEVPEPKPAERGRVEDGLGAPFSSLRAAIHVSAPDTARQVCGEASVLHNRARKLPLPVPAVT